MESRSKIRLVYFLVKENKIFVREWSGNSIDRSNKDHIYYSIIANKQYSFRNTQAHTLCRCVSTSLQHSKISTGCQLSSELPTHNLVTFGMPRQNERLWVIENHTSKIGVIDVSVFKSKLNTHYFNVVHN